MDPIHFGERSQVQVRLFVEEERRGVPMKFQLGGGVDLDETQRMISTKQKEEIQEELLGTYSLDLNLFHGRFSEAKETPLPDASASS